MTIGQDAEREAKMIPRYSVTDRARGLPTHPYRDNSGSWVRWEDVKPYLDSLSSSLNFLVEVGLEPPEILSPKRMRDYSKQKCLE